MKCRIHLLTALLLLLTAWTSDAQYKKRTAADRAEFFTKEITDYIPSISAEQKKKLVQINLVTTLAFDSLKALNLESNEYKPAARNIFVTRDAQVKDVLNAQQYDEYMMLQAEKKQKAMEKKNGGQSGGQSEKESESGGQKGNEKGKEKESGGQKEKESGGKSGKGKWIQVEEKQSGGQSGKQSESGGQKQSEKESGSGGEKEKAAVIPEMSPKAAVTDSSGAVAPIIDNQAIENESGKKKKKKKKK